MNWNKNVPEAHGMPLRNCDSRQDVGGMRILFCIDVSANTLKVCLHLAHSYILQTKICDQNQEVAFVKERPAIKGVTTCPNLSDSSILISPVRMTVPCTEMRRPTSPLRREDTFALQTVGQEGGLVSRACTNSFTSIINLCRSP